MRDCVGARRHGDSDRTGARTQRGTWRLVAWPCLSLAVSCPDPREWIRGAVGDVQMTIGCIADPICEEDFNHSSVVTVQDIFDFLAAYFAGCN